MPKSTKALPAPATIDLDTIKEAQLPAMFDAEALGQRAAAMLAHCDGLKKERVIKCILAGIFLAQIRAELGHGKFGKWLENHLCHNVKNGSESARTAYRYIGLAGAFSRTSKLLLPELIGANQLSLDLSTADEGGRTLLAKIDTFVGQRGLTENMKKYGVIKMGGARTPREDGKPEGEDAPPPWATEGEKALWATLQTESAKLAFIDWRPRLQQMGAQAADLRHSHLPHLDDSTKGDLIVVLTEVLGVVAPHVLKHAPKS
ncbi:MAG: hypothetical protein H7067_07615 [Burkholderiales bacterium]|nr:hypothetical protein [Opitutaceae bacterium]